MFLSGAISGNQDVSADIGDTLLVVLHPALDQFGDPDQETDTSISWMWRGATGSQWFTRDTATWAASSECSVAQRRSRFEKDSIYYYGDRGLPYNNVSPMTPGEGWYWRSVRVNQTATITMNLPAVKPDDPSFSTFRVRLHSTSPQQVTPNHKIRVRINGVTIDTLKVNGYETYSGSVVFPSNRLVVGANVITMTSLSSGAGTNEVLVDWVDIEAPNHLLAVNDSLWFAPPIVTFGTVTRFVSVGWTVDPWYAFRVDSLGNIHRWMSLEQTAGSWSFTDSVVPGARYVVTTRQAAMAPSGADLRAPTNALNVPSGADYVIISPHEFSSTAERLRAYRAGKGIGRTTIAFVDDLYDQFSDGRMSGSAVRNFLQAADSLWPAPVPSMVLLFGDATWDPKDHFKTGKRVFVPTLGNPVSDALFVVDPSDQFMPLKSIGRLPASTTLQAEQFVDALIDYDSRPLSAWNKRFLFFASGFDSLETLRFQQFSDGLISGYVQASPLRGNGERIYRTANEIVDITKSEEVRERIDTGGVWINYYGHAGTDVWANGISTAEQLTNEEEKQHLITDISCSTARFAEPLIESFGEMMVRADAGRAIGYIGASGFGFDSPLRVLADGMYSSMASGERMLGKMHLAAKQVLRSGGASTLERQQAIHQWTLLGDPATKLRIPTLPDYTIHPENVSVQPAEPAEGDTSTAVQISVTNFGTFRNDTLVVRIFHTHEGTTAVADTLLAGENIVLPMRWRRSILASPGFHSVRVELDPDRRLSEEHTGNNGSSVVTYVVATSRLRPLSPLPFSRVHPESAIVVVLSPSLNRSDQSLSVQVDTIPDFSSPGSVSWSSLPVGPVASVVSIASAVLGLDVPHYWRARVVSGGDSTHWVGGAFLPSQQVPRSWMQNSSLFATNPTTPGLRVDQGLAFDDRPIPVELYSAGFSDGLDASITLNGDGVGQGFITRGYNIALVNELTGDLEGFSAFSIYSDAADTTMAEPLIRFLEGIQPGRRVLVAIADEGGKNKTERLNKAFESIGSAKIRTLAFRGSWAISGWKGAAIGSVREAISASGAGAIRLYDTLAVSPIEATMESPWIGPVSRWHTLRAELQDTGSGSSIDVLIVRKWAGGMIDTVHNAQLSPETLATLLPAQVADVKLLARFSRPQWGMSPKLLEWSADFTGLPEIGGSVTQFSIDKDSVNVGELFNIQFPVTNAGFARVDTVPYAITLRSMTGVHASTGSIFGLDPLGTDTIIAQVTTAGLRGPATLEVLLDPDGTIRGYERGNELFRHAVFVFPDTVQPAFAVTVDGKSIVSGDYISAQPEIRVQITDDGVVPIASPSNVLLRIDGRPVTLGTATPDSLFESRWNEKAAFATFRPKLSNGAHTLGIQVTDGSGNPADTAEYVLDFRVEETTRLLNVINYPNPFEDGTQVTFELSGMSTPLEARFRVFTVAGRKIHDFRIAGGNLRIGFNSFGWDGHDAQGDDIANGVYLGHLSVVTAQGTNEAILKLAKAR